MNENSWASEHLGVPKASSRRHATPAQAGFIILYGSTWLRQDLARPAAHDFSQKLFAQGLFVESQVKHISFVQRLGNLEFNSSIN